MNTAPDEWFSENLQVFWGEIAPSNHLVQIYDNEIVFLNTLEGFAGSGFIANETVIIIAGKQHLEELNERLLNHGFNLKTLIKSEQYIPLDADKTLQKFMVNNWPDADLFNKTIGDLVKKATKNGRKVRAFGEMVAILWEKGNSGATVQLEHLWNEFCTNQSFGVFCAYPKSGFTADSSKSLQDICTCHSKIISGSSNSTTEVIYKNLI